MPQVSIAALPPPAPSCKLVFAHDCFCALPTILLSFPLGIPFDIVGYVPEVGLLRVGKCADVGISHAYWVEQAGGFASCGYVGWISLVRKLGDGLYEARRELWCDDELLNDVAQVLTPRILYYTPLVLGRWY